MCRITKESAMKKSHRLMFIVAVAAGLLACSAMAFAAADPAPAAPAAKPAAAAPAAKPAPAAAGKAAAQPGVPVVVTGKVESKLVKSKKTGAEVKRFSVTVATAKGADGAAMDALKGTQLTIGCKNRTDEVEKFVGKDAEIAGGLIADKHLIRLKSIK